MKNFASTTASGLVIVAFSLLASVAHAQWAWIDSKGTRQYSDTPPPADVPKKNILRTPAGPVVVDRTYGDPTARPEGAASAPADGASAPASVPAASASAARAGASKPLTPEEAFQKRQKDLAAAQAKAQKDQTEANKKSADCQSARNYASALQSGQRVSQNDAQGNKQTLNDTQRASELARAQESIAATCN